MFKKTAIVIAMATLATGSFAAELSAGKDTKFEVNVELGAYYQTVKGAKGTSQPQLIGKSLNQVEIKATHNLSADVSVFGEYEMDFDPIVDNDIPKSDDSRFGIASKRLGRFSVGQFDSFFEDNVMEVLGTSHGDLANVTEGSSSNDGRHLQYSHKLGDLSFALDLTANNNNADNSKGNDGNHGAAIAAVYQLGNFSIGLGYSDVAKYASDATTAKENGAKSVTGLTGSYKLGDTRFIGLYATETARIKDVKTTYTGLAVKHVMGEFDIGVAFQNRDNSVKTFSEWSVGLGYTPLKNFTMFLDFNGLGQTDGVGDVVELGAKYAF